MKKLITIMILSIIASINAVYLTIKAYGVKAAEANGPSFCDINSTFSCSNVFAFDFSWMFGIPFSAIAMVVYPVIFLVALLGYFGKTKNHYKILLAMSVGGFLFNSWIIFHEFQVMTFCILCLMCTLIIIAVGIMSHLGLKEEKNKIITETK